MRAGYCAIGLGLWLSGAGCGVDQRTVSTESPPLMGSGGSDSGRDSGRDSGSNSGTNTPVRPGATPADPNETPPGPVLGSAGTGNVGQQTPPGATPTPPGSADAGAPPVDPITTPPNPGSLASPRLTAALASANYSQECAGMTNVATGATSLSLFGDGTSAAYGPMIGTDLNDGSCTWPATSPVLDLAVMFRAVTPSGNAYSGAPPVGEFDLSDPTLADRILIQFFVASQEVTAELLPSVAIYQSYEEATDLSLGVSQPPRELAGLSGTVRISPIAGKSGLTQQANTFVVEVSNLVLRQPADFLMTQWPATVSIPSARLYW